MTSNDKKVDEATLISVVTPVYNQADTLRETIESVLAQTYTHIEYIIINDGSTDGTQEILNEYTDSITVIEQSNQGQSAALNRAWESASGRYLMYLSADDIMYPDCIETLVTYIDGKTIVYYPDYDLIDAQSKIVRRAEMPDYNRDDLVVDLICQPGLSALFCADVYRALKGWDTSYRFIPDFEFWARMSNHGSFKHIPQVVGGFRVHEESGSVKAISVDASDEIIRFVNNFKYNSLACKKRALFRSRLMSARSHFQSRRVRLGIIRYFQALVSSPIDALKLDNLKFVSSGLVRRIYYRLRASGTRIKGSNSE